MASSDVRVKICGITNFEDARVALEAGADFLGFILYAKSPRYIPPDRLRELRREIGDWLSRARSAHSDSRSAPKFVGVFVNESAESIDDILAVTGIDYAQIHGDESTDFVQKMAGRGFKAVRPVDAGSAHAQAARFAPLGLDDGPQLLLDAYDPAEYGGTGKKADWHVAAELARRYPRLMLAGGLSPANVAQAIHTVRPWAVDVSSGVESAPGRKDHEAVRAFLRAARGA